uniref:Coenzyme F420 hydrogenase/dehydrogenase, beta subunit C-terminal domain n=1 Tax=Polymorphobacter sp. TaxID=1909290 RepID=UPI003F6F3136
DGRHKLVPFLMLPLADLRSDFWPTTCRTCVDYTNSLADITVGYMAGEGDQWLLVRNERGSELLALLDDEIEVRPVGSKGDRTGPVKGFLANTVLAAGGLPLRRMPNWLRPIVGRLMPLVGPKGLEFARARVEMKALETVLFLRRQRPGMMKNMIPPHVWTLAARYGLAPEDGERKDRPE